MNQSIQIPVTEDSVKNVKRIGFSIGLDPLTRVLLDCLAADDERPRREVVRRLIRQEAARRGFWMPPSKPWERREDEEVSDEQ